MKKTTKVGRRSVKTQTPARKTVFDYLRRQILDEKLNFGERLIETAIANQLDVSRTPVREAFRKLENEGLVRYSPGRGVTVSRLSKEDMLELYSIRGALEGLAARMAAEQITPEELKDLKSLMKEMEESHRKRNYRYLVQLHTRFNELIYRAAHSPRLYEMVTRFHEYTERSQLRALSVPNRFQAIQAEHERIVAALESRRPKAAEKAVRNHIEQARYAYLQTLASEELLEELTA
jgi:DNA-binding GntR family transcriptional regulator